MKKVSVDAVYALQTLGGAMLVIAGVVVKNSGEQLSGCVLNVSESDAKAMSKPVGISLFAAGWMYLAHVLSKNRPKNMKTVIRFACIAILVSALAIKHFAADDREVPVVLPVIFGVAWSLLGLGVSSHLPKPRRAVGLLATACVLVSMTLVLPWQRKTGVVDGPGMPLYCLAWGIVVWLNAVR